MMKSIKYLKTTIVVLTIIMGILITSCERPPSDDVRPATYPATAEVFIDGFSGGLEYLPFAGSKLDAFTVDDLTYYEGTAAMRFDVPNVGDPDGSFAGAIFPDYGKRDLSGFDALTFYARASKAASINEIGFGNDFGENKYLVVKNGLSIGTAWKKYIIPIPDPSKLTEATGMFWYAEGPEDGAGYTFWVDELKYEKLGTLAHPRPSMFGGEDRTEQTFIGIQIPITALQQTFNLANGLNETVNVAPAYFDFESSDESVATVGEDGVVTVVGSGSTEITASLGGIEASGSLIVESLGEFIAAPTPTEDPADVISIFSDAYTNVPVDYYNGFFLDGFQTTLGGTGPGGADITINGNGIINYTQLNFVGIGTFENVSPLDLTDMTHLHVDIQVQENVDPGDFIRLQLLNSVGSGETSGSYTVDSGTLVANQWVSVDVPLTSFTGLTDRSKIGLLFFISDNTISNILVDNIYYYK